MKVLLISSLHTFDCVQTLFPSVSTNFDSHSTYDVHFRLTFSTHLHPLQSYPTKANKTLMMLAWATKRNASSYGIEFVLVDLSTSHNDLLQSKIMSSQGTPFEHRRPRHDLQAGRPQAGAQTLHLRFCYATCVLLHATCYICVHVKHHLSLHTRMHAC